MNFVVHKASGGVWTSPLVGLVVMAAVTCWTMEGVMAATPLEESQQLVEVCNYGPAAADSDDLEEHKRYHHRRRHLIHEIYETPLPALDKGLMGYDRVAGLLTISGFRTYRPHTGGPAIRFRNECILSFEFDEDKAHDLMAQLRMGTVEVRIGYQLAARRDYDVDYCPRGDDDGRPALEVDLLYAHLVDTERSEDDERHILGTYHTPLGHRAAVYRSMKIVDSVAHAVPEVAISDLQWRPSGESWGGDFGASGLPDSLGEMESELTAHLERALYPCYLGALSHNAALQGALVLEVPFGADGEGRPEFLLDTLEHSFLGECVVERVETVMGSIPQAEFDDVDAFKATVLMRRR